MADEVSPEYTAAVVSIRGLLARWIDSGIDLYVEIRRVELAGDWRAPGHASFTDFLAAEFPNAIGFERYENVIQAIEVHGLDFVRRVGVHACHATTVKAIAEHPERAELLRASVDEHVRVHGVAPDRNKIRDMVVGIAPEVVRPSPETRAVTERRAMQARIRELTREVERLTRERDELAAECERLRSAGPERGMSKGPLANRGPGH